MRDLLVRKAFELERVNVQSQAVRYKRDGWFWRWLREKLWPR